MLYLVPGGAISNLYAVLAARHAALPAVKTQGVRNMPHLIMLESDQASERFLCIGICPYFCICKLVLLKTFPIILYCL